MNKSCFLLMLYVIFQQADSFLSSEVHLRKDRDGTVYIKSGVGKNIVIQPGYGGRVIINGRLQVCEADGCIAKLGSRRNPALSCKAILENDPFAPNGVYYLITEPYVSKVYCYMEYISGCEGGGWTTIMKTDGHKPTFTYSSALWQNKVPYHVTGGQSGEDDLETKLPTYWTMPFNSLCLGMKTTPQSQPKWIRLNYNASSLYSVIADGLYRNFSIGRSAWKSLIPGSSLLLCYRETVTKKGSILTLRDTSLYVLVSWVMSRTTVDHQILVLGLVALDLYQIHIAILTGRSPLVTLQAAVLIMVLRTSGPMVISWLSRPGSRERKSPDLLRNC